MSVARIRPSAAALVAALCTIAPAPAIGLDERLANRNARDAVLDACLVDRVQERLLDRRQGDAHSSDMIRRGYFSHRVFWRRLARFGIARRSWSRRLPRRAARRPTTVLRVNKASNGGPCTSNTTLAHIGLRRTPRHTCVELRQALAFGRHSRTLAQTSGVSPQFDRLREVSRPASNGGM